MTAPFYTGALNACECGCTEVVQRGQAWYCVECGARWWAKKDREAKRQSEDVGNGAI